MAPRKSTQPKKKTTRKASGKTSTPKVKASASIPFQNGRGNGNTNYAGWMPGRMSKRWAQSDPSATGQPVLTGQVFRQLVARAQMVDAQFPIASQILSRGVEHIVQLGFTPSVVSDDTEWNYECENLIARWLPTADLAGNSFLQHQQLVCRSWLRDGDVAIIFSKDDNGSGFGSGLQIIESARVVTPLEIPEGRTIIDGVELSGTGAVEAIHVAIGNAGETKRVRADFCAFLCRKNRACAVRGEGVFTQLYEIMDSFTSYIEAVARAADQQSRVVYQLKTDKEKTSPYGKMAQDEAGNRLMQMDGGSSVWVNPPGGELSMLKAENISLDHGKFIREIMRILHNALGMPLDVTDPSDSNYSSSRIALQQAQMAFRLLQQLFIDGYLKKAITWFVRKQIELGNLRDPGRVWSVDFVRPAFKYQDRLSETQADLLEINTGLKSYRQAVNERGLGYEQMLQTQVDEISDRELYKLPPLPRSTFIQQTAPAPDIRLLAEAVADWTAGKQTTAAKAVAARSGSVRKVA